ncbi:MAG: hypothetical protein AAFQ36_11285 [Pseudomonadota bacterium]
MLLTYFVVVVVGLACGGVALWLRLITRGRLPRWIILASVAGGMLGYTIYSEYTWYEHTAAQLDEGIVVLRTIDRSFMYQPWSYAVPITKQFTAVDQLGALRNPEQPGLVLADVFLFARFAPVISLPMLVDCDAPRRADIADADFDENGVPTVDAWIDLTTDDPLIQALCQ